jgi:hypothetical protein
MDDGDHDQDDEEPVASSTSAAGERNAGAEQHVDTSMRGEGGLVDLPLQMGKWSPERKVGPPTAAERK